MSSPRRFPASWRYLRARLESLVRPAVLLPALGIALLGVFFWELNTHPEWLAGDGEDNSGPEQSALGEALSPEARQAAADIDNLSLLSNDLLDIDTEVRGSVAQPLISPSTETAGSRFLASQGQSGTVGSENAATGSQSPAANGLFSAPSGTVFGSNNSAGSSNAFLMNSRSPMGMPNSGAVQSNDSGVVTSALERALNQQSARPSQLTDESVDETTGSTGGSGPSSASVAGQEGQTETAPGSISQSTPLGQGLPQPMSVPSSFIRTTPAMSPPPGTTGYTLPPTLYQAPTTAPVGNAYTNLVNPAANLRVPQPSYGVPMQPGSLSAPGVTPLPNRVVPTGPAMSQPLGAPLPQPIATPAPPPFSASRRAPGQYGGSGQINTFSNP